MATWGQMAMNEGTAWTSLNAFFFHDHIMVSVVMISTMVGGMMISMLLNKFMHNNYLADHLVEIFWTIYPAYILFLIANPSLMLLYLMDFNHTTFLTIKIIGHQWYWSYEYDDWGTPIQFDSYMIPTSDLMMNEFRLLEVDNRLIMPIMVKTILMITSTDVIHAWALPAAGIKMDAIPGRINSVSTEIYYPGIYYGQCSEICGANHSFMPIALEAVSEKIFLDWIFKQLKN